ncbi:MAG: hypothetical protein J5J00_12935 [Deltaproteobacteria bacterium]|nr:hypothetical protein [Deltaproteobacteria bacterium]
MRTKLTSIKSYSAALMVVALSFVDQSAADDRLKDMISPVSHPVTFEDPRHSTELRGIFAYHEIGDRFVTAGGDVQVYALQARFKVNEDLSVIATKDGYVVLQPDEVVPDDNGMADIALGMKYSFLKSDHNILTGGLRYEAPLGEEGVFQGQGDGAINPFASYGQAFEHFNFIAASGLRLALDSSDSSFWDLDLHFDMQFGSFYPLIEFNFIHVLDGGDRLPIADEGEDFFNFGAIDSGGKSLLTMATGARYRLSEAIDLGAAYQFPLTDGNGSNIIDWRVTTDLIIYIN